MLRTIDRNWFNVGAKPLTVRGNTVVLWEMFKRRSTDGHWWGVGLLHVNRRSLFFVGRVQGYPEREVWSVCLLFRTVL